MSDWRKYRLSDLGKIITGKTPSTTNLKNFGTEYPFITPVDMTGQKYIYKSVRNLSELGKSTLKNYLLPPNTICISCIGSDLGKVIKTTKPSFTNQQINSIICNENFNSDFVYYAMKTISPLLKSIGHNSTAVPIINKTDFSLFEINIPKNILTQNRIASILSSLDDKIELNHQTNQTLEMMTQTLFKEMCLPKGDELPEGWKIEAFEDVFDVDRGLSYKGDGLTENDGIPMHNLNSIFEGGGYKTNGVKYYNGDYKEKHIVKAGELIIANTEQGHKYLLIGYPAIVPEFYGNEGIFSHHIYRLRPKQNCYLTSDFIYYLLLQPKIREQIVGFANGTTVNMLKIDGLKKPTFAMPTQALVEKFIGIAKSNRQQIEHNIQEVKALTDIRDSLLPKLMKGEINL